MMKTNEKNRWIQPRHKVVRDIAFQVIAPYARMKYGVQVERFKAQGDRPYLILMNHQTAFDQFFVGMAFSGAVYYLATEDIFSLGWLSSLLRYFLAPIPIKKQTTDLSAVRNCIRVSREGGTIAIAPEGNRTYNGKTVYINPSIVSMIKMLRLPVAFFRIEDGYGVQPRWSDVVRRGKMRAYVSHVLEPEEYAKLSDAEIYQTLLRELDVSENRISGEFHHKRSAEYLERAIYVCPECGLSTFESRGDTIECKKCGMKVKYTPTKELQGEGKSFPFRFVADWYDYQCDFVRGLDLNAFNDAPMYTENMRLSEVIINRKKVCLRKKAVVALNGNRIEIDSDMVFPFEETSAVTVLGKNKLNIYSGQKVYQIKGDKRFNALKYVNMFYHYRGENKEGTNGEFLGL